MGALAPSPVGTPPSQSWLMKWNQWEIQAVVVVSFVMQVILFLVAGIRRYNGWFVLKVLLWLVYLLADTAAIYALGHMAASLSRTSSSDKHQLVAFWAPFLLLHLGGQDTITAYALEDNELWLRHLLELLVQLAGTGYVLYKYIIADRSLLLAAMCVTLAGSIKYIERIWALRCASKGSYGPNRPVLNLKYDPRDCFTRNTKFRTYAFIVMTAHKLRYVLVKPLVIERNEASIDWSFDTINLLTDHVEELLGWPEEDESTREKRHIEEVYRAIEVELALAYDMLYTKAEVLHTWYGYFYRVIILALCFSALVAFTRSKRDRYSIPDIVITFVLLGGACTLEVASAIKLIGSTWTYAILKGYKWTRLANAILFVRYYLIVLKDGRWSDSVGQYDFLFLCGGRMVRYDVLSKLKGRMAGWLGLEDWWIRAHYTKQAKLSPALKKIVWGLLIGEKSGIVEIKDVAVQRGYWARMLTGFNQSEELDWSLMMEFHNCVYIWHMATSTFLNDPDVKQMLVENAMAEAVNTLSDYMMYLLVQHPEILPMNAAARSLFRQTYASFLKFWDYRFPDEPQEIILNFVELKRDKTYGGIEIPAEEGRKQYQDDVMSGRRDGEPGEAVLAKASILVRKMLDLELELTHKLVIIGRVWTEMLCYAATTASGDFHARQLSNGGEFLTHMLLLTKYYSALPPIVQDRYRAAADQPESVAVPVEPTVEAADHVELNVDTDTEEEITEVR